MSKSVATPSIKAIETSYKGYRFRSRHEVKWAVFFDALGIRWEYEPEGFDLGEAGWYLPDFWLPKQDVWVEVKPAWDQHDGWPDTNKQDALQEMCGKEVVTLCGLPGPVIPYDDNNPYEGWVMGDFSYYWCECPYCGAVGIQFDGRSARNRHAQGCRAENGKDGDKNYNLDSSRLLAAYAVSRAARFEHGAQGA